jgi:hypothetical protein
VTKDLVEEATKVFLTSLGLGAVVYEPNNVPDKKIFDTCPDFSVGNKIGVEVTRLTQIIERGVLKINLTQELPIYMRAFGNTIRSVKKASHASSYFVAVDFQFPLDRKSAQKLIVSYLSSLTHADHILPHTKTVSENLSLTISSSSRRFETIFEDAGTNTPDTSGWVLAEILEQGREAILRKTTAIERIQHQYPEWWLAVGGTVTIGLQESYIKTVAEELTDKSPFSKLLLIDVNSPLRSQIIDLNS